MGSSSFGESRSNVRGNEAKLPGTYDKCGLLVADAETISSPLTIELLCGQYELGHTTVVTRGAEQQ